MGGTGQVGVWVAGFCETITSSASAKAGDEARAELGNNISNSSSNSSTIAIPA